jgi:putative oxygen-independent coproporphyrinogen III oxidase
MAGIYIHIPFCKQKCTYCDFHFSTTFSGYREEMIEMILLEIERQKMYLEGRSIDTVYFGGGTPSLLTVRELQSILNKIQKCFTVRENAEITLEANPDDITKENLTLWKNEGINRLSIGLQSFKKEDLKWMNRAHTVEESLSCVNLAEEFGFKNLTVDLIYGLPNLSIDEWESHIQKVINLNVPHISAYCLTVENKTVLHNLVSKGKITPATEDQQSEQFLKILEMMERNGYVQYEISNFCKKGYESIHNSNYWKGEWYLGIGPSAHSFNGVSRKWNLANNQKYMTALKTVTQSYITEELSKVNQFNEKILIGLRTVYGVHLSELNDIHPVTNEFNKACKGFIEKAWMENSDEVLRLTKEGKLRADYISSELFLGED